MSAVRIGMVSYITMYGSPSRVGAAMQLCIRLIVLLILQSTAILLTSL